MTLYLKKVCMFPIKKAKNYCSQQQFVQKHAMVAVPKSCVYKQPTCGLDLDNLMNLELGS